MLPGHPQGMAVVTRILFPHYPLTKKISFFSSSQYLCTEVIGSRFVMSVFLWRQSPRDAIVPTE